MRLTDVLTVGRILVDLDGGFVHEKADALRLLSGILAPAVGAPERDIEKLLADREELQSTGIGDGVAIPHASVETADSQASALLLCPRGVPFDAIDGARCTIVFGVIGPRKATGEHLRLLARISRMLRDVGTRQRLVESRDAQAAYQLLSQRDDTLGAT